MFITHYIKNYKTGICRKSPATLIFFVTNKCNSKCRGCFYWKSINKVNKDLTLVEIAKISKSLPAFPSLLISGGEPFLRVDLPDILERFYSQNRISFIHLPTNGLLTKRVCKTTRTILEKCTSLKILMSLPLDGLEDTNDYLRGVNGSFKKAFRTAECLLELKKEFPNLVVRINTVVSNANYNEIGKLFAYVKENLDVDYHVFDLIRGEPKDKRIKPVTAEQWQKLIQEFNLYYKYYREKNMISPMWQYLRSHFYNYVHKWYSKGLNKETWPFKCVAGSIVGVLESDGRVRLCELTKSVGNVKGVDYDFQKIWHSREANHLRERIKSCSCYHPCFLKPSVYYSPRHFFRSLIPI